MRKEVQNLFKKTYYVVEYNPKLNIIDTTWYGYASKKDIAAACEVGLELLEEVRCPFKLNDNTQLNGPWSDSVEWMEQTWLPRAMRAGIKYLAHVATKDEALAWLKECQKTYQQPAL
jgi:hypothetical protein